MVNQERGMGGGHGWEGSKGDKGRGQGDEMGGEVTEGGAGDRDGRGEQRRGREERKGQGIEIEGGAGG